MNIDSTYPKFYLAIEGIDGAGKTSAIKVVKRFLEKHNFSHIVVREPGGTAIAESLRTIVKSKDYSETLSSFSEFLIFSAARRQLLDSVVKPALDSGSVVVSDRCFLSTVANQGIDVMRYNAHLEGELLPVMPSLIIYLDIDVATSMARVDSRGEKKDRIESKPPEYFNEVRQRYLNFCNRHYMVCKIVDASQSISGVSKQIEKILSQHFN